MLCVNLHEAKLSWQNATAACESVSAIRSLYKFPLHLGAYRVVLMRSIYTLVALRLSLRRSQLCASGPKNWFWSVGAERKNWWELAVYYMWDRTLYRLNLICRDTMLSNVDEQISEDFVLPGVELEICIAYLWGSIIQLLLRWPLELSQKVPPS
jgi:hypothetical protein